MDRAYLKTHPFVSFRLDLSRAPAELWMLLGEARSKCEHIAGVPLKPVLAEYLHKLYLAKGALATTAIEGNTLSEAQAVDIVEGKSRLPASQEYLATEIENIVAAANAISKDVREGRRRSLTVDDILDFNRRILRGLELADGVEPGVIRQYSVGVSKYRAVPAEDVLYLMQRLCDWLNGPEFKSPSPEMEPIYGVLKAVVAHLYLAWIHGFGDGNGRTARLVEFQILVGAGFPSPAAHLLSNHYNQTRTEYYRQLHEASASGGDIIPFLLYAVRGLVDELRQQLAVVRQQQLDLAWQSFIVDQFHQRDAQSDLRRRMLIEDLSRQPEPVPLAGLLEVSPRVAAQYARRTPRTLIRDVRQLMQMQLIERVATGYQAKKTAILAFLPPRAERATDLATPVDLEPPLPDEDDHVEEQPSLELEDPLGESEAIDTSRG